MAPLRRRMWREACARVEARGSAPLSSALVQARSGEVGLETGRHFLAKIRVLCYCFLNSQPSPGGGVERGERDFLFK